MDIDEFLDREFSELDSQTGKTEPESGFAPEAKEDFKSSPTFDEIRANLISGELGQAEKSYNKLWGVLLQQKLKWNREIYDQLSVLTKHFLSALNQNYDEVKRKADHVYDLINKAKAMLREGKKDMSLRMYAEIKSTEESIPSVFFEEKKIIEEQIAAFYNEISHISNNDTIRKVSALVQETQQMIEKIDALIRANDIGNAIASYNKCIELYSQIPEGFLRHKNSIGIKVLEIYKSLSLYTEISNLQREFSMQIAQQQRMQFQQKSFPASSPAQPAQRTDQQRIQFQQKNVAPARASAQMNPTINHLQNPAQPNKETKMAMPLKKEPLVR